MKLYLAQFLYNVQVILCLFTWTVDAGKVYIKTFLHCYKLEVFSRR
jgi:hypothetical protein